MSNRAEERANQRYALKEITHENVKLHDEYVLAYSQAEKDTIERAVAWLKEHANNYTVDLTPTYPDAPVNIIVGGKCWEDLKEYLENE